jgi:hypothetical protein
MRHGVFTFFNAEGISPVDLGVALEERELDSLSSPNTRTSRSTLRPRIQWTGRFPRSTTALLTHSCR